MKSLQVQQLAQLRRRLQEVCCNLSLTKVLDGNMWVAITSEAKRVKFSKKGQDKGRHNPTQKVWRKNVKTD